MRFVEKLNKTQNKQVNWTQKQAGKSEKNKTKMAKFTQKHAQISFCSELKQ